MNKTDKIQHYPAIESNEYYFKEGCYILEMLNSTNDPEVSVARARVDAGGTTLWHRLSEVSERYVIVEGQAIVDVEHESFSVSAGDVVVIPRHCAQRIRNTGTGALVFLAICTPRFTPACYAEVPGP